jgi:hypothetical protein
LSEAAVLAFHRIPIANSSKTNPRPANRGLFRFHPKTLQIINHLWRTLSLSLPEKARKPEKERASDTHPSLFFALLQ